MPLDDFKDAAHVGLSSRNDQVIIGPVSPGDAFDKSVENEEIFSMIWTRLNTSHVVLEIRPGRLRLITN